MPPPFVEYARNVYPLVVALCDRLSGDVSYGFQFRKILFGHLETVQYDYFVALFVRQIDGKRHVGIS